MGIWATAADMAAKTPNNRNRYVDFLRAVSILFVISGHWLIATAFYADGELKLGVMLSILPWTQWLTWLFQVMPVFFFVGGYANAVSLESARKRNANYAVWLAGRLHRLVTPLFLLLIVWAVIAVVLNLLGLQTDVIKLAAQAALIPIWFLAIYTMVVLLAPATYAAWRRWGFWSFSASVLIAVLIDVIFFRGDMPWLAWTNYFWIWLAMHQLGYAWRDGRLPGPRVLLVCALGALSVLVLLVMMGPYPIAMAGSPDETISNTLPPKIPLLALGLVQFCTLLAIEKPVQQWLARLGPWTGTVLINSMIMTVYLWHMTVMMLLVAAAYFAGGFGLTLEPGGSAWWWTRPIWIGTLGAILIPTALVLSGLERRNLPKDRAIPSAPRQVCGALMICLGVAVLASSGFDGQIGLSPDTAAFVTVIAGAALSGLVRPG